MPQKGKSMDFLKWRIPALQEMVSRLNKLNRQKDELVLKMRQVETAEVALKEFEKSVAEQRSRLKEQLANLQSQSTSERDQWSHAAQNLALFLTLLCGELGLLQVKVELVDGDLVTTNEEVLLHFLESVGLPEAEQPVPVVNRAEITVEPQPEPTPEHVSATASSEGEVEEQTLQPTVPQITTGKPEDEEESDEEDEWEERENLDEDGKEEIRSKLEVSKYETPEFIAQVQTNSLNQAMNHGTIPPISEAISLGGTQDTSVEVSSVVPTPPLKKKPVRVIKRSLKVDLGQRGSHVKLHLRWAYSLFILVRSEKIPENQTPILYGQLGLDEDTRWNKFEEIMRAWKIEPVLAD